MNETSINGRRTKILFIITKSNWGGAQKYVFDLATHLDTKAYAVTVAAGGEGMLMERLKKAGIRTLPVPWLGRDISVVSDIMALIGLVRIVVRERPDVVHLNSSKAGVLGAVAARGVMLFLRRGPVVIFTVHGWAFFEDRPWPARFFLWCASWFASLFHDHVILISGHDLTVARKFIPRRKISYIPHGLSLPRFLQRPQARAYLMRRIQRIIPASTIVVGTIAELTPNKRLEDLIDAFMIAQEAVRSRRMILCIIGAGEEKQALARRVLETAGALRKEIFFLGFIPDASDYLRGFDLFVLPSSKEGLPYILMEAMSAGLPIIATSVGGVPDLIADKTDGILVSPRRPDAIAEAIVGIVRDPAHAFALGAHAREKIKKVASLDDMVKKTAELYANSFSSHC